MSPGRLRKKAAPRHQLATIGLAQPDEPGLISIAAAAKRLGIAVRSAYEWANRGELPGLVVVNNRRYVKRLVLERYLADE